MRIILMHSALFICFICLSIKGTCQENGIYKDYGWTEQIRDDHPRLFLTKDSFQKMKERALNEENEIFEEMKEGIDLLIGKKIEFKDPLAKDGTLNDNHKYGTKAAEAAFIYLVLEDEKYLSLCKKILINTVDYYTFRNENHLNIYWDAFSRINALTAYDWIFNSLTEQERTEIGLPLLHAIKYMLPDENRNPFFRENRGQVTTGFYGARCLSWYAGLVFHKEGINDSLANRLLLKGYDEHIALLAHRSNIAGEAGGAASSSLNYSMGRYPWAEFNFFHTFNSATGLDISEEWPYVPHFIHYILWNWLPGDKEFGYGDVSHITNDLPLGSMHIHLSQIIHFFGETHPEIVSLAKWMLPKVKKRQQEVIPFVRFLLTKTYDEIKPKGPPENMRYARHFDNMGQLFMRSGSGADDTYALFTAGGMLSQHRHYDNNNFVIFKKGYLAMDTGTRPQPGLHLSHYYCRTVAHNCITIKMPGEIMPDYWGGSYLALNEQPTPPVPNDGGQNNRMGSEVIAFDENEYYVYIASDATESYHPDKTELVLRQFVFLPPDYFVIFDRVNSTNPEYKKRWLLHTAKEPTVKDNEFFTDHWEGRLFCKTLLPQELELSKTGGPGKQFWSDGRNWPMPELIPEDWNYERRDKIPPDTHDLLGQWRIEVTPEKSNTDDVFLHILQAGDKSLKKMAVSSLVENNDMTGVRFVHESREYEVMFKTGKKVGGKISIIQNGQKIMEEEFTEQVKKQTGLF